MQALADMQAKQESEQAIKARELIDARQQALLSEQEAKEKLQSASVSLLIKEG